MITKEEFLNFLERMGPEGFFNEFCIQKRRTGRSHAIAFWLISYAIQNHGTEVRISDHYPNRDADKFLFDLVRRIVSSCRLTGWTMNHAKLSIKFDHPYGTDPMLLFKPEE